MDKIYSRKRLLIPKFRGRKSSGGIGNIFTNKRSGALLGRRGKAEGSSINNIGNYGNGNKMNKNFDKIVSKKTIKTAIVVIIAVFMANRIISIIEPTIDVLCRDMAKSIATEVSNEQATVVMRKLQV